MKKENERMTVATAATVVVFPKPDSKLRLKAVVLC
jgi:hypothetical protein